MEEKNRRLLQKFLLGHCSKEELAAVNKLLEQQDARNALDTIIQEQTTAEWNQPPATDDRMQERMNRRLANMQHRIGGIEKQDILPEEKTNKPVIRMAFLRYAAACAVVLLVAATAFWFTNQNRQQNNLVAYIEQVNQHGKPVRYVLPDSSSVYLAAGSKLKYPEQFTTSDRMIQLQGEAFFEVQPDAQKPFIVHAGNTQTRVLGTSFKISAFSGELLEVAVATGKVAVSTDTKAGQKGLAVLTHGLKVTWNSSTGETTRSTVDIAGLTQWAAGELTFNEQPLVSVATALERRYQVHLQFADEKMKSYRVSGTFSAEDSVTSVLDMLGFVGKFSYKKSNPGSTRQFTLYKSK
jgi:ferric-dicitrate binding protein FerR (iron transport regulator)